jgi:hypothetical protein
MVKIRIICGEYAVAINDNAGLFMQRFGDRVAKAIGTRANFAGNHRDGAYIPFVRAVFMAVASVFTACDITVHG